MVERISGWSKSEVQVLDNTMRKQLLSLERQSQKAAEVQAEQSSSLRTELHTLGTEILTQRRVQTDQGQLMFQQQVGLFLSEFQKNDEGSGYN